jgi:assimilatory nitrate reductase catalytic subunit
MNASLQPSTVRTTCPYCGVGCGVLVTPGPAGSFAVAGDPEHPANLGRLCSKGAALGETLGGSGRLLYPQVEGRRVDWDQALDQVAAGLAEVIDRHGPDAVAFYVSGQLLTEDYYVANKLMKGFIGSGNIDTNSRLCMSSSVAAYKRAFGADTVPCDYRDLELADLVVLVGSNTAWCHPVLYQRIRQARRERPGLKVMVIDPRRTATCEDADLHLALAPGSDTLLFNGLLDYLRREDALDWGFLEAHTQGFADAFRQARAEAPSIPAVAAGCGLPEADVAELFRTFARTERCVTLYSQGVNQWSFGTDKANAIINCHLATGRIGRPGMGPFSITGQPNAMGGREVGGLANQLAAHMDFTPQALARVAGFWGTDRLAQGPGLKAVDLFRAVEAGAVKAVWVMATNPAVSLPDADRVRQALRSCELVIVSDMTADTDTAACARILLPAATWGEKDGTVTNSERTISRQRAFTQAPGEARPDWWILTQVARRMGHGPAFPYETAAEVFREHAALTALDNTGVRDLDLGALAGLDDAAYGDLAPVQWPAPAGGMPAPRPFADGRFYTDNGKARFVAVTTRPPAFATDADFPLVLNTGRVRDQWHTMTRTARAHRLTAHTPEPFLQIHPADAELQALADGDLARVESRWGRMLARVVLDAGQRRGSVFVPMHWSDVFARQARADALVNPAVDPVSGQPESKHTPVRVSPYAAAWHAFVLSRNPIADPPGDWCVRIGAGDHWRYELAGGEPIPDLGSWARGLLGEGNGGLTGGRSCTPGMSAVPAGQPEWLDYADSAGRRYRGALLVDGRLAGCVFAAPGPALPGRAWLGGLFAQDVLDPATRAGVLAGKPARGGRDAGETVCACFNVGLNTIRDAIREGRALSVEAIGTALRAGTNCGSCLPEIARILGREGRAKAGERAGV